MINIVYDSHQNKTKKHGEKLELYMCIHLFHLWLRRWVDPHIFILSLLVPLL